MIRKLSEKILTVLIRNQGVKETQRDIVLFGIEQGIVTALEITLLLITSAILGSVVKGVIILMAFTTIRIYAGGYHAKTQIGCVIRTWIFFVMVILCQNHFDINIYIQEVVVIWNFLILVWICPLENEKRKFVGNQRKTYRKKAIRNQIIWIVILNICVFTNHGIISQCITWGVLMANVLLITGKLEELLEKQRSSEHAGI